MPVLTCSVILALLQAEPPPGPGKASPLEVRVRTSDMVTTSNPLTVYVDLTNVATDRDLVIESLEVSLPDALTLRTRSPDTTLVQPKENLRLGPGTTTTRITRYKSTTFHQTPLASLGYRCGDHQIRVRARYRVLGTAADGHKPSPALSSVIQMGIQPRAGLAAVIVGGVIGVALACLLSLLSSIVRPRKGPPPPQEVGASSRRTVADEALTLLYGSLVTTSAIFLLQATTVPGFPVSISLCDPLGGLILGLFFRPVGQFIQEKVL
jgi:hypothetical protein